jgi:hypothetical protein
MRQTKPTQIPSPPAKIHGRLFVRVFIANHPTLFEGALDPFGVRCFHTALGFGVVCPNQPKRCENIALQKHPNIEQR